MNAVAEFIRKLYKRKRHPHDVIPRIEGEMSSDWMALDLGRYTVSVIRLYKILVTYIKIPELQMLGPFLPYNERPPLLKHEPADQFL